MGLRFRRSIKIFPGVHLNIGMHGVSTSIGTRGVHITYGANGTRTTIGIPGTGVSYTQLQKRHRGAHVAPELEDDTLPAGKAWRGWLWIALAVALVASLIAAPR